MGKVSEVELVMAQIDNLTREGTLYRRLGDRGTLECFSCGHRCIIKPGRRGICKVRYNENGTLRVPHGYVALCSQIRLGRNLSFMCTLVQIR